ncbi:MAG: MFS transporter [Alphaproteobacteria bacterium]|nr:MFS transporter [Alphaproteobacteria bacterium]
MKSNNVKNNKRFRYWRRRTLYSIMIGYGTFYLVRQNFALAIPFICTELNVNKIDIGLLMSIGGLLYGFGKFLFGLLGDKYSARYVMAIGLLISGILNVLIGITSLFPALAILYALNQVVQAMGAPPCVKLMKHWYSVTEMGRVWSIWTMASHISSAMITFYFPVVLIHYGWKAIFYLPGIISILLSVIIFNRLNDTPETLGFPPIEKLSGNNNEDDTNNTHNKLEKLSLLETIILVIKNKNVLCVSFAALFVYINRMTFLNWGPTLLMEYRNSSNVGIGYQMALFEISGIVGALAAGYVSDKLFNGRRAPVGAISMFLLALTNIIFRFIPKESDILSSICMLIIGFLISATVILVSVSATDFVNKKIAASANGFTGTLCYIGTAVAGIGNGYLAYYYGWNAVVLLTIISAICGGILLCTLWNKKPVADK